MKRIIGLVAFAALTGCASTVVMFEHPYDKAKSSEYAPENENASKPMGVGVVYYTDGAGMHDDGNEAKAQKMMYDTCGGKYRIIKQTTPNDYGQTAYNYTVQVTTTYQCLSHKN
jgi:hypothetical protein